MGRYPQLKVYIFTVKSNLFLAKTVFDNKIGSTIANLQFELLLMETKALFDLWCQCCPHEDYNTLHTSRQRVLYKIYKLILDEEGCTLLERQFIYFNHYFGLSKGQLVSLVPYLQFVPIILEYLCQKLSSSSTYISPLLNFLYICGNGPVITKTSDLLIDRKEDLTTYFNCLGNCLLLLEGQVELQKFLINLIENVCLGSESEDNRLPFDIRKEAVEQSCLPELLVDFLLIAPKELHNDILYIIHQITVFSVKCSLKLLKGELFGRLVLFSTNIKKSRIADTQLKEVIMNILWRLIECGDEYDLLTSKKLPKTVLRNLGSLLKCEALYGSTFSRNDILSFICKILFVCEKSEVARSGILKDLFLLNLLMEFEIENTWASNIKFMATEEDVQFKKVLLITLSYLINNLSFAVIIAAEYRIMSTLAVIIDPHNTFLKTKWTNSQKLDLLLYALNILPFVAPHFPEQYIKHGFTKWILFLTEYFSTNLVQTELLCNCVKTLYLLLVQRVAPVDHFRQLSAINIFISLCKNILLNSITTLDQIVLSYSFSILSELCINYKIDPRYNNDLIIIITTLLKRFRNPSEKDYKLDESLLMAAGSFIWMYIASFDIRKLFIQKGLVYLVLDIIEKSLFPIQVMYTGILADIAEDFYSVVPMVTWRGKTEDVTILPLLCKLWRTQENTKGVLRGEKGCVKDIEHILKGKQQREGNPSVIYCPPLLEMYGCIRPKIYAIVTFLMGVHYERAQKAIEIYGIQIMDLGALDKVTLTLIYYYEHLKKGEIWENMLNIVKIKNTSLLPELINYLEILDTISKSWGINVHQMQHSLIRNSFSKLVSEEEVFYAELRHGIYEKEISKFYEVQNEMCCTSVHFLNLYRDKQLRLLEEQRRKYNYSKDDPNVHLTHNLNVYASLEKTGRVTVLHGTYEEK